LSVYDTFRGVGLRITNRVWRRFVLYDYFIVVVAVMIMIIIMMIMMMIDDD